MPQVFPDQCAICGSTLRLLYVATEAQAFGQREDGGPAGPVSTQDVVICRPCRDDFLPTVARDRPGVVTDP